MDREKNENEGGKEDSRILENTYLYNFSREIPMDDRQHKVCVLDYLVDSSANRIVSKICQKIVP